MALEHQRHQRSGQCGERSSEPITIISSIPSSISRPPSHHLPPFTPLPVPFSTPYPSLPPVQKQPVHEKRGGEKEEQEKQETLGVEDERCREIGSGEGADADERVRQQNSGRCKKEKEATRAAICSTPLRGQRTAAGIQDGKTAVRGATALIFASHRPVVCPPSVRHRSVIGPSSVRHRCDVDVIERHRTSSSVFVYIYIGYRNHVIGRHRTSSHVIVIGPSSVRHRSGIGSD